MAEAKCVLWLTEKAGAGETALAGRIATEAKARGYDTAMLSVTDQLVQDPVYSTQAKERDGVTRLASDLGQLLAQHRVVIVQANLPPPRNLSDQMGRHAGRLVEVRVRSSSGEIERSEIGREDGLPDEGATNVLLVSDDALEDVMTRIVAQLEEAETGAAVAMQATGGYNEEEEEQIRRRLEDLGYL